MNSTEDDTFNMLKSLTEDEAIAKFAAVYIQVTEQLGRPVGGVPVPYIKAAADLELKPYGWSYDRIFGNVING